MQAIEPSRLGDFTIFLDDRIRKALSVLPVRIAGSN